MNYYDNDLQVFAPPANKKYHGLLNQGATCYLNSVLQVLFMTEDFREAVERFTCGSDLIDHHLQALFEDLKKGTTYTYNITKKLGIDRVNEQRDAAEYYEKILTQTSHEASKIFHGQLTHVTICSTCRAEKNRDGLFWHLPLELVDSYSEDYSVVDGTEEYFRDLNFSGENQMYCDQCDAKSDATVKCVMKHHPEVLTLLLKRFQFDYCCMSYVKNPRVVDVPSTLHIPENQTYELYAVVDHFGDLRSGHYTATIKSQADERWYKFDDSIVTLLDYQPSQEDHIEKSYSAYLLFYRKRKIHSAGTCTQGDREVSTNGGFPPAANVNYDHGQQFRKREEDEKTEEKVGNDTAEPVSIYRNEQTGNRDMVVVGSVDDIRQRGPHNPQQSDEESRDYGDYPPDAHTEKGELCTTETQPRERVNDQSYDNVGTDYSRESEPDFKPEVRDRHARYNQLNTQDEMNSVQRRVTDVKTDMDRKTEGDEQSETTDKSLTEYLNRYEKHQGSEGLDDVNEDQQNRPEDDQEFNQGGSSRNERHEQQGEEMRGVKGEEEQNRRDDEYAQRTGTFTTEPQPREGVEDQDKRGSDDDGQNRPEQNISVQHTMLTDVDVEEQTKGQENKEDEQTDNKEGCSQTGLERMEKFTKNQEVEKTTLTMIRGHDRKTDMDRKTEGDEQSETTDKSLTEYLNRYEKHQGSEGLDDVNQEVEKTTLGNSNPNETTGISGPKHKTIYVKITEVVETPSGIQSSSQMTTTIIKTIDGISQYSIKSQVNNEGSTERKSDPETDAHDALSENFSSLKMNESLLPNPQNRNKRVIEEENEPNSIICSHAKKIQKMSDS